MGDLERQELAALVRDAVRDAMPAHSCRFTDVEARTIHQMSERLTADQLTTLSLVARALNSAGARLGQALVWGILAAALGALLALVKMGFLKVE